MKVIRNLTDHQVDTPHSSGPLALDPAFSSSKRNKRANGSRGMKNGKMGGRLLHQSVGLGMLIFSTLLVLIGNYFKRKGDQKQKIDKRTADFHRDRNNKSPSRHSNSSFLSLDRIPGFWRLSGKRGDRIIRATKPVFIVSVFLVCFVAFMLMGSLQSTVTSAASEDFVQINDVVDGHVISLENPEFSFADLGGRISSIGRFNLLETDDKWIDEPEGIRSVKVEDQDVGTDLMRIADNGYSPASSMAPFFNPSGCKEPPPVFNVIARNGWGLNLRTYSMLEYAVELFGGEFDLVDFKIVKNTKVVGRLVFGLIQDGAVIKISLLQTGMYVIPYDEVDNLVAALRVAGFAAWFRDAQKPEGIYIEAIPIGDKQLTNEQLEQVMGEFGYFNGFSGLESTGQLEDPHGGPVICQWMVENGHVQAHAESSWTTADLENDWRMRLKEVAETYITTTPAESYELAREIGFLGGTYEDPSNMCGPLTAAILRDADLLPSSVGPVRDPKNFWYANPGTNGRPWTLFPLDEYDLTAYLVSINRFEFSDWPLCPGDIVFTYAGRGEFSHLFVVTEVDDTGRAFSVTNQSQPDFGFLVERVLLYDPDDPSIGAFRNEWTNDFMKGRTGLGGFDVLRRKGVCLPAGSSLEYYILPGDTLITLTERYNSTIPAILLENDLSLETTRLIVGQIINIPANISNDRAELVH